MQIGLDPEQRALGKASGALAADLASGWDRGRGPSDVASAAPSDADWARIVEAGWPALRLREENGGLGAAAVDVAVLVEQLGRHSVAAPVIGTLVAAEQLQALGAPAETLEAIAAGELRVAPLLDAGLLGFAPSAEGALAWDSAGATLAYAPDGSAHALGEPLPTADVTRSVRRPGARVTDRDTALRPPAGDDRDRLHAFVLTLLVADLLGTMSAALDAAVEHATTRTQFGRPIGSFQAVQQIAAEDLVSVEATRSALYFSAWAVDALPPAEALRAARTAKAFASRSGVAVCQDAVQLFGGIGMTWESPAHVWLRRAQTDRTSFGDEHAHQAVLADLDLAPGA
ncbi:acyl-CoA dehydrogenase [Blastococcus sp. TF02A-26]|uniref:acyl-CoA dehydrogenase n=1 Tax=Blastococcus sp. TF02A-26 TaxID=2250577 RepID=UPI000DE9D60E|nr:acyl-CoA dehydrogenase [Blastococcus sp. TF02A-26]RBY84351.1 acyl-CoA dehydrogenase [Blastococcus sp. TF02A-26]